MALSLGATTPTALYLGTTAISAAYLGATQVYSTGGGDAYAIGGASPELVAAFTTQSDGTTAGEYYRKASSETTFSGLFTHSVSGLLTMFDSSGTLVWAPHNLFSYSEDFTQSYWAKDGLTFASGPTFNGFNTTKWVSSVNLEKQRIYRSNPFASAQGGNIRIYGIAQADEWDYFILSTNIPGINQTNFDLTNGVIDGQEHDNAGIESLGDGWYLCWIEEAFSTSTDPSFYMSNSASEAAAVQGDGSSGINVFAVGAYHNDLGGMANNPDQTVSGLEKYVPTTSAAVYLPRRNAYRYNSGWELAGMQMEAAAATNLTEYSTPDDGTNTSYTEITPTENAANSPLGTSQATLIEDTAVSSMHQAQSNGISWQLGTQYCAWAIVKDNGRQYCWIGFASSAFTSNPRAFFDLQAGTVVAESGTPPDDSGILPLGDGWYLIYVTATCALTQSRRWTLGLSDDGPNTSTSYVGDGSGIYVAHTQAEAGALPSSPIITTGSTVTRAAETLSIAGADTPANTTAMSISMKGLMTYADDGAAAQETFLRWYADANNYISLDLDTDSTATGEVNANQSTAGTLDTVVAGAEYSPGVNVAFNIASRHTSGAVNVAKDGTAATADTTPTALADLSSTALQLGYDFNGFISEFRMWGADIGDSGISEVTA